MRFPVSGVHTPVWVPPRVALVGFLLLLDGGISGAGLLLPSQMSVRGSTGPAVSTTNRVFNIVAIPGRLYRYPREWTLIRALTWVVVAGMVAGVIVGQLVRFSRLPDPRSFKSLVGCVLLYIGGRMVVGLLGSAAGPPAKASDSDWRDPCVECGLRRLVFDFQGRRYWSSTQFVFHL